LVFLCKVEVFFRYFVFIIRMCWQLPTMITLIICFTFTVWFHALTHTDFNILFLLNCPTFIIPNCPTHFFHIVPTTKTGRHDTAEDKYHLSNCFMIMTSYGPWVGPFQNCVRQPRPPFKMAAVTKNRNFFNCPLLL
jgi:hypothetical protein